MTLWPAAAQGVPALTTTSTVTTKAAPGASTVLQGLSVTNSNATDILQVTVSTDVGTLSMAPDPDGLTLAYGNSWAGDSAITFDGLPADVNNALDSVELLPGDSAGEIAHVSVAALVSQPGYVYSPANEHFYEYVAAEGITWDAALAQAGQRTLDGQQGYLATIPDAEVNDLVASKLEGAQSVWFGALADQTPDQPVARTWRWAAGPLAGEVVSKCSNFEGPCDFVDNAGLYSNWSRDEPNNAGVSFYRTGWYEPECDFWMWGEESPASCWDDSTPAVWSGGEEAAVTNWGSIGFWNDLPRSNPASGYVVEYGDEARGDSSFEGVATDTSSVSIEGPPLAPTGVDAQRGDSLATVTFTDADGNGSQVTGYTVSVAAGEDATDVACSGTPCTLTGLTNGTEYTFTVRATNDNGDGPDSSPATATPSTVAAVPTDAAAEPGDRSATVSFEPPVSDGGAAVSGYTVTAQPGGETAACLASPCLVDGLDNGTAYTFTVRATNVAGDSDESEPTAAVVPAGVPTAPTDASAQHGNGSATVSFTPPGDNGSPITGYTVTTQPGGSTTGCDGTPCTVTGLTNGAEYTFTVHAANGVGAGAESDATQSVTPATVPDAPGEVASTRGDERIDLSFDAPTSDGGSPITGYQYSLDAGETWSLLDSSGTAPVTGSVSGLTNGTPYAVQVRAVNAEGHSTAAIAGEATPARAPDAPSGVTATRADGEATVSFTAGAANGSATTHTVTAEPGGAETSCSASPCVVSGLTNGTAYTFRVVSTNEVGDSDPSDASTAVTPAAAPAAPGNVVLTSQDSAALLSFDAADTDPSAPVTEYEVSLDGGESWQTLTTHGSGPITSSLTGLSNGTAYTALVRARNEVGAGDAAAGADVTPAGRPSAARDVDVTPNGTTALVTWTAPLHDGGSPVTGYTVTASPGDATCTDTGTSCTLTGLVPGTTYTFTVVASNAHAGLPGTGDGAGAEASTLVPTRPGPPESLRVRPGDRTLGVSWALPVNQGGSAVSGYVVSTDGGGDWRPVRTTLADGRLSTRVVAVRNGASYSVMVRALNAAGPGTSSEPALTRTAQWFRDPVSAAARERHVAVPRRPNSYRGPLRHTTATARSHDGTPAMTGTSLGARKLQSGQAASVRYGPLFEYNSTVLSARGRAQVKSMVRSLTYVEAVTCEGFADYGGRKVWEARLAQRRAVVVCQALRAFGADVATTVRGYGSNSPVTIGGDRADRAANRRVVVRINRG